MAIDQIPLAVESISIGMDVTFFYPQRGVVSEINDPGEGATMVITGIMVGGQDNGQPKEFVIPRVNAMQAIAGLQLFRNLERLPYRSWWTGVSGSIWYVRADGLLYCDTPGGQFAKGSVQSRATLMTAGPLVALED